MQRINFFRAIVLASMTLLFAACGGGRQLDLEPRSQGKQRIGSAEFPLWRVNADPAHRS